jgi:hypothetical protein
MSIVALRSDFAEATAHDRLVLETVVGGDLLLRQLPTSSTDDLRGPSKSFARSGSVSLGAGARDALLDEFRPLLLVTGWKLLDLMVELVREATTGQLPPVRGWRIRDKVQWSASIKGGMPEPFSSHPEYWTRLTKLYSRLEEPRNAVVHRQFRRSDDRGLVPYGVKRRPLRTISVEEIDALVFASYGLAEEVIAGKGDQRRDIAISWRLDQLRGITRLAKVGPSSPPQLRRVLVNLEKAGRRWRLDLAGIRAHLRTQDVATDVADIEAYVPGTARVLAGRLEDAPSAGSSEFAASKPPSWLTAR